MQWGWIIHHGHYLDKHCLENCWICSKEKGSVWKAQKNRQTAFELQAAYRADFWHCLVPTSCVIPHHTAHGAQPLPPWVCCLSVKHMLQLGTLNCLGNKLLRPVYSLCDQDEIVAISSISGDESLILEVNHTQNGDVREWCMNIKWNKTPIWCFTIMIKED